MYKSQNKLWGKTYNLSISSLPFTSSFISAPIGTRSETFSEPHAHGWSTPMSQHRVQQRVPDTPGQDAVLCSAAELFAKPIYPLKTDWISLLYGSSASLLLLTWALAASWALNVVWSIRQHDPSYTKSQFSISKQKKKTGESNPIFSNLVISYENKVGNHHQIRNKIC